jgi:hypothetical protein
VACIGLGVLAIIVLSTVALDSNTTTSVPGCSLKHHEPHRGRRADEQDLS